MKFAISAVVLLICSTVVLAAVSDEEATKAFVEFAKKYNKRYASEKVEVRYANFKASLERVAERNKKSKNAVFGITKFSDLSPEEFRAGWLMKDTIKVDFSVNRTNVLTTDPNLRVPDSLDWRARGAVTKVKDQGQCGSCWAFSVTENIESMWILAGRATNSTLALAPQQIVDCDTSDGGCSGGNPPTAYDYVISAGGMEPNSVYPYTAQDGNCAFQRSAVIASITSWKYATSWYSEKDLQQNLVQWGPLSVCVDAASWQDYTSGVMTWEDCAWVNILDHCVQLVGYSTNNGAADYWIVRNSWNTDWGVNGYIYLQMWGDTCGIAHEATSSVV